MSFWHYYIINTIFFILQNKYFSILTQNMLLTFIFQNVIITNIHFGTIIFLIILNYHVAIIEKFYFGKNKISIFDFLITPKYYFFFLV